MPHATLVLDTLDDILDRILARADELAYLTLTDRTVRRDETRIGRLDLTPRELGPYLDDDLMDEGPVEFVEPTQLDPDVLERALRRWIIETAEAHIGGREFARFRLRAYAVKGHAMIGGGMLTAEPRTDAESTALASGPAELPEPMSFEELEVESAASGMRALGSYYAQWGALMLGSVRQLQHVNHSTIDRLNAQVGEARGQVDELLAALLETRAAASLSQVQQDAEVRRQQTNTMLAQQAINGIGEAAKAFAMAKSGVDPSLASLAQRLSGSPDLLDALQDDDVQDLMNDPDNLKAVAGMLKQAAQAQKAMKAAKKAAGAKETSA